MGSSVSSQHQSVPLAAVTQKPESHTSLFNCFQGLLWWSQNADNYHNWWERHVPSICNKELRPQSPPLPIKLEGTMNFALHTWSHKTEPCQQHFQNSTAQKDSTWYGRWTKRSCKWEEVLPETTDNPNDKTEQIHEKAALLSSSLLTTLPFPHTDGSSWLIKSKLGDL